jgi:histidinol-phosphatase (PHP family)
MINFDYHMHTNLSDGANTHEEMILSAIDKGFNEIGFSDHFCIKFPVKWAVNTEGIARLEAKVGEMKQKFGNRIKILFGLEVDYFPEFENEIRKALQRSNFDYVIGSIHFLDDWNYDTDKSRYAEFRNDYLYEWYFGELQNAVKSGLFDYMAHPDLIKKHRIWPNTSKTRLFRETAKVFADFGVAYEVNTSGKDRPCKEFFPGMDFLNELFQSGVPVTMGSDSHQADQIGRYFDEAKELLRKTGYQSLIRYKNREKIVEPL